jgi:predicted metal-dependent phosphoesterase TrpH
VTIASHWSVERRLPINRKGAAMIKVELHSHTADDPEDFIAHSARDLVDRAVALGYGALAITLHDRHFCDDRTAAYARDRGLTLIPSVERTIADCHLLLINFPEAADRVAGFDEVRALKRRHPPGLVIAPHPWFPLGKSLGPVLLERHADLWDAIEINAFYTRIVDFNRQAWAWADARGLPLVGNCDVHQLRQLGTTYSLVDVETPCAADAVCDAIRAGRVRVESRPLSHLQAAGIAARALLASFTGWPQ